MEGKSGVGAEGAGIAPAPNPSPPATSVRLLSELTRPCPLKWQNMPLLVLKGRGCRFTAGACMLWGRLSPECAGRGRRGAGQSFIPQPLARAREGTQDALKVGMHLDDGGLGPGESREQQGDGGQ